MRLIDLLSKNSNAETLSHLENEQRPRLPVDAIERDAEIVLRCQKLAAGEEALAFQMRLPNTSTRWSETLLKYLSTDSESGEAAGAPLDERDARELIEPSSSLSEFCAHLNRDFAMKGHPVLVHEKLLAEAFPSLLLMGTKRLRNKLNLRSQLFWSSSLSHLSDRFCCAKTLHMRKMQLAGHVAEDDKDPDLEAVAFANYRANVGFLKKQSNKSIENIRAWARECLKYMPCVQSRIPPLNFAPALTPSSDRASKSPKSSPPIPTPMPVPLQSPPPRRDSLMQREVEYRTNEFKKDIDSTRTLKSSERHLSELMHLLGPITDLTRVAVSAYDFYQRPERKHELNPDMTAMAAAILRIRQKWNQGWPPDSQEELQVIKKTIKRCNDKIANGETTSSRLEGVEVFGDSKELDFEILEKLEDGRDATALNSLQRLRDAPRIFAAQLLCRVYAMLSARARKLVELRSLDESFDSFLDLKGAAEEVVKDILQFSKEASVDVPEPLQKVMEKAKSLLELKYVVKKDLIDDVVSRVMQRDVENDAELNELNRIIRGIALALALVSVDHRREAWWRRRLLGNEEVLEMKKIVRQSLPEKMTHFEVVVLLTGGLRLLGEFETGQLSTNDILVARLLVKSWEETRNLVHDFDKSELGDELAKTWTYVRNRLEEVGMEIRGRISRSHKAVENTAPGETASDKLASLWEYLLMTRAVNGDSLALPFPPDYQRRVLDTLWKLVSLSPEVDALDPDLRRGRLTELRNSLDKAQTGEGVLLALETCLFARERETSSSLAKRFADICQTPAVAYWLWVAVVPGTPVYDGNTGSDPFPYYDMANPRKTVRGTKKIQWRRRRQKSDENPDAEFDQESDDESGAPGGDVVHEDDEENQDKEADEEKLSEDDDQAGDESGAPEGDDVHDDEENQDKEADEDDDQAGDASNPDFEEHEGKNDAEISDKEPGDGESHMDRTRTRPTKLMRSKTTSLSDKFNLTKPVALNGAVLIPPRMLYPLVVDIRRGVKVLKTSVPSKMSEVSVDGRKGSLESFLERVGETSWPSAFPVPQKAGTRLSRVEADKWLTSWIAQLTGALKWREERLREALKGIDAQRRCEFDVTRIEGPTIPLSIARDFTVESLEQLLGKDELMSATFSESDPLHYMSSLLPSEAREFEAFVERFPLERLSMAETASWLAHEIHLKLPWTAPIGLVTPDEALRRLRRLYGDEGQVPRGQSMDPIEWWFRDGKLRCVTLKRRLSDELTDILPNVTESSLALRVRAQLGFCLVAAVRSPALLDGLRKWQLKTFDEWIRSRDGRKLVEESCRGLRRYNGIVEPILEEKLTRLLVKRLVETWLNSSNGLLEEIERFRGSTEGKGNSSAAGDGSENGGSEGVREGQEKQEDQDEGQASSASSTGPLRLRTPRAHAEAGRRDRGRAGAKTEVEGKAVEISSVDIATRVVDWWLVQKDDVSETEKIRRSTVVDDDLDQFLKKVTSEKKIEEKPSEKNESELEKMKREIEARKTLLEEKVFSEMLRRTTIDEQSPDKSASETKNVRLKVDRARAKIYRAEVKRPTFSDRTSSKKFMKELIKKYRPVFEKLDMADELKVVGGVEAGGFRARDRKKDELSIRDVAEKNNEIFSVRLALINAYELHRLGNTYKKSARQKILDLFLKKKTSVEKALLLTEIRHRPGNIWERANVVFCGSKYGR
jgi:hypothetical protein